MPGGRRFLAGSTRRRAELRSVGGVRVGRAARPALPGVARRVRRATTEAQAQAAPSHRGDAADCSRVWRPHDRHLPHDHLGQHVRNSLGHHECEYTEQGGRGRGRGRGRGGGVQRARGGRGRRLGRSFPAAAAEEPRGTRRLGRVEAGGEARRAGGARRPDGGDRGAATDAPVAAAGRGESRGSRRSARRVPRPEPPLPPRQDHRVGRHSCRLPGAAARRPRDARPLSGGGERRALRGEPRLLHPTPPQLPTLSCHPSATTPQPPPLRRAAPSSPRPT